MNSKGFTLVELLVTITLLIVAGTIIAMNMAGISGNNNSAQYKKLIGNLETAGCSFMDLQSNITRRSNCKASSSNSGCKITLDELINSGLVDKETIDPTTDGVMLDGERGKYYIQVEWVSAGGYQEKQCTCHLTDGSKCI